MRVVVAPDSFGGTLSAAQAADAIGLGWCNYAQSDQVTAVPMSDGGPGFVEVLHAAIGGTLEVSTVSGPYGEPTPAVWLRHDDVAYLESAQACGLSVSPRREPLHATTVGVGELCLAALSAGVRHVVIGLGGSATNDGGTGLLSALGATADRPLDRGPAALEGMTKCDLTPAQRRLDGIEVTIASDVDSVLLGLFGASKTFGPQKGLGDEEILRVDAILDNFVNIACGTTPSQRSIADARGAGAAGGLGFALLALGGQVTSGIDLVGTRTGLAQKVTDADLVITGEGRYDFSSRAGKVVYGVAQIAAAGARPCIVLAGQVDVGSREMRAMGVESGYSMIDLFGAEASLASAGPTLTRLAERVARTWSRDHGT